MELPKTELDETMPPRPNRTAGDIARDYRAVLVEKRYHEGIVKDCNVRLRELDEETIAWAEREGTTVLVGDDLKFETDDEPYITGDRSSLAAWLMEHAGGKGLQSGRATGGVVADLVASGVPLPDGVELKTRKIVRRPRAVAAKD